VKNTSINDTPSERNFQPSLPINVDYLVGMDESVRTVIEITENLDNKLLYASYKKLPQDNQFVVTVVLFYYFIRLCIFHFGNKVHLVLKKCMLYSWY